MNGTAPFFALTTNYTNYSTAVCQLIINSCNSCNSWFGNFFIVLTHPHENSFYTASLRFLWRIGKTLAPRRQDICHPSEPAPLTKEIPENPLPSTPILEFLPNVGVLGSGFIWRKQQKQLHLQQESSKLQKPEKTLSS